MAQQLQLSTDTEIVGQAMVVCTTHLGIQHKALFQGRELVSRVGSGRATTHRCKAKNKHLIIYGRKMIEDKISAERACFWLTFKEIQKYGFYGGTPTFLHLIGHTVIHEFGHAIQTIEGHRTRGSVHNRAFYDIVGRLHAEYGQRVLAYLVRKCQSHGLDITQLN
ncbi:MAG: hypothetical protein C9356_15270 [Oleiphilus sp.]|nr:MAG: hypothetical protein C9356_15270 [Oleiphilus sp.]